MPEKTTSGRVDFGAGETSGACGGRLASGACGGRGWASTGEEMSKQASVMNFFMGASFLLHCK
jgi:hypothetical protein